MADSWDDQRREAMKKLKAEVVAEGGAMRVLMRRLRDDAGWSKLGVRVAPNIIELLQANGMEVAPRIVGEDDGPWERSLPRNQNYYVTIYVPRSPMGRAFTWVFNPHQKNLGRLRNVVVPSDADETLDAIKRLVNDQG